MRNILIARSMREMDVGRLMDIYYGENAALDVNEFYQRVMSFFQTEGAFYAILKEQNTYLSALRVEPYLDGAIITGLETPTDMRCRGYATDLLKRVLPILESSGYAKVYSHVERRNKASMCVHDRCGFFTLMEHAVLLDGTVSATTITLCKENTADSH